MANKKKKKNIGTKIAGYCMLAIMIISALTTILAYALSTR